jgi:hypothetical protein
MRSLPILLIINILSFSAFAEAIADSTKPISLLYNGAEYVKQFNPSKGDPFFPVTNNTGSVKYQHNWYNNIEIHYDCEDDYVLIRDMRGLLKLRLINDMLDEFTLDGHRFVKKSLETPNGELYELIVEGKRTLLVKWVKRINSDVKISDTYVLRKHLLLQSNGKLYPVETASDIIRLSPEHSRELKKAVRDNHISFRQDPIKASEIMLKEMEAKGW